MNNDYLIEKRIEVLEKNQTNLRSIWNKEGYDYEIDDGRETLRINNTGIGCSCNSISAVVDELIGYIFINTFCKNRSLGAFEKQVKNRIKEYWINVT